MPGLSSSTLNLKFMQRGAARTTSTPSTPVPKPSGSSTPRIESSGPAVTAPDTPTIEEPLLVASEEPYRWSLSQSAKPAQTSSGVKFETSYLPFIDQTRDESPEAGPSKGGGGRMVFGYKEPEQEDLEKDDEGEDEEEEGDVVINVKKEKEREKGKREYKKPRPMMNEKGFMRPRSRSRSPERNGRGNGSLLPNGSKHGGKERGSRTEERQGKTPSKSDSSISRTGEGSQRVKIEPSSPPQPPPPSTSTPKSNGDQKNRKRKPSQSTPSTSKFNINTTGTTSDKKPKLSSPTMINDYPTQATQASQSTAIDDREAALKAQKKKEKNARKKARKSAE